MKITEALITEHVIFLSVFEQIERVLPSLTTPTEVRTLARVIEGLLQGHAAREANLAYLALDHVLAERGELERMHQDHRELDDRLQAIHTTNNLAEARQLLKTTISHSREHYRLEERTIFPLLEKVLQPETLHELGQTWVAASREPVRVA